MASSKIHYKCSDIMQYRAPNSEIPAALKPYCTVTKYIAPNIFKYEKQLNEIINTITKGDNPNTVEFVGRIKCYVNTINKATFPQYNQKIMTTPYTTVENVHFVIKELIKCIISVPISYKGMNVEEDNSNSIPEICADVLRNLCDLKVTINEKEVKFYSEILSICQTYFVDFINKDKHMDENNMYNADNYKGFMTMMGLLYARKIITDDIVVKCAHSIIRSMFTPSTDNKQICSRTEIECSNLYKGYEFLMNHVVHQLKKQCDKGKLVETLLTIHQTVDKLNGVFKTFNNKKNLVNVLSQYNKSHHEHMYNELMKLKKSQI